MRERLLAVAAITSLPFLATGCADDPVRSTDTVSPAALDEPAPSCDPGAGLPVSSAGCAAPETGWLTAAGGTLTLRPFRTLVNGREGAAYARDHGVEYPFPNDHFDAPDGPGHALELVDATTCTGIMLVGRRQPLEDHAVDCDELVEVAAGMRVPVAVWSTDGEVVQVSELYRP